MAEMTRSPSLPSTADANPYVPVSWMAVAAVVVAGLFALLLLAFGSFAFINKKPLLMEELLILPVIAIVLSFAARRMIRNSEGTRTGEKLANTAWWMSLILGLCYVAYLFAFDLAIRQEARGEVDKWMDYVKKGTDEDILLAFHRTLPPGKRQSVGASDATQMQLLYRDDLLVFRNSDLLKLAQRNHDFQFTPGAVTWVYKPGAIEANVAGTVKCPEGTFPVSIALKGLEGVTAAEGGGGGRQWTVTRPQTGGFIDQALAARTRYGWLVLLLELDGSNYGIQFIDHAALGPLGLPYVYRGFVVPNGDRLGWGAVAADRILQLAFAVPAQAMNNAGYTDYLEHHLYKGRNGTEPSADKKAQFLTSWNTFGLRRAGDRLKDGGGGPIDKESQITVTETAVQVRVPVEIPLLSTGSKHEVARGRVVVECTDPKLLAELKQLKEEAKPDQGTTSPPEDLGRRKISWRVLRIESDMVPVNIIPPGGPGGRGGMPGGMGG
jgi:hypothetical protein